MTIKRSGERFAGWRSLTNWLGKVLPAVGVMYLAFALGMPVRAETTETVIIPPIVFAEVEPTRFFASFSFQIVFRDRGAGTVSPRRVRAFQSFVRAHLCHEFLSGPADDIQVSNLLRLIGRAARAFFSNVQVEKIEFLEIVLQGPEKYSWKIPDRYCSVDYIL